MIDPNDPDFPLWVTINPPKWSPFSAPKPDDIESEYWGTYKRSDLESPWKRKAVIPLELDARAIEEVLTEISRAKFGLENPVFDVSYNEDSHDDISIQGWRLATKAEVKALSKQVAIDRHVAHERELSRIAKFKEDHPELF